MGLRSAQNFKLEAKWKQHPSFPQTRGCVVEGRLNPGHAGDPGGGVGRTLWPPGSQLVPSSGTNETEKGGDSKLIARPEAIPRVKHLQISMC